MEKKETAAKRPGRKPLTDEQKAVAAKLREEEKKKAENLKPAVFVQFQETEVEISSLVEMAKEEFHKEKKRTLITDMRMYVKPEERTAYYVINEKVEGKIEY